MSLVAKASGTWSAHRLERVEGASIGRAVALFCHVTAVTRVIAHGTAGLFGVARTLCIGPIAEFRQIAFAGGFTAHDAHIAGTGLRADRDARRAIKDAHFAWVARIARTSTAQWKTGVGPRVH